MIFETNEKYLFEMFDNYKNFIVTMKRRNKSEKRKYLQGKKCEFKQNFIMTLLEKKIIPVCKHSKDELKMWSHLYNKYRQKEIIVEEVKSKEDKPICVIKKEKRHRNRNFKMTYSLAQQLRSDYKNGIKKKDLIIKYGISEPNVYNIIANRVWTNPNSEDGWRRRK